jgi:hypothetical protein
MRLIELEPRWLDIDGRRVGIMLLCPHCRKTPLSCFFIPTKHIAGGDYHDSQYALFAKLMPTFGDPYVDIPVNDVVPCRRGFAWQRTGDDFASMSITPSLDASAAGHWHGFITSGEIR